MQSSAAKPRAVRFPAGTALVGCIASLAVLCTAPGAASAANPITSFSAGVLIDENTAAPLSSDYATQAGAHPDVAFTKFTLDTTQGSAEYVRVDLPAGLAVNPQAIPRCSASGTTLNTCAADTRVGTTKVTVANIPLVGKETVTGAVYNMTPTAGNPSDFAFQVTVGGLFTIRTDLVGGVRWYPSGGRPGDFGDYFTISSISNLLGTALEKSELIFWGAPEEHNGGGAPDNAFLTNPTSCEGPQTTYIYASTYAPVQSGSASFTTPVGATGCATVPFAPTVSVTPATTRQDTPDGLTIDLQVPQSQAPGETASAHLKDAAVTLPAGLSLNPAAANGLAACTDVQFGAGTSGAVNCPGASAVGTVEVTTPVLGAPLTGSIYVGQPLEGDPYRVFIDAENATAGVAVRLTGTVTADPVTGRLTSTFSGNPQVPFSDLRLSFKTGAGALFANPLACGAAATTSILAPWSGAAASTPSSSFTVDANGSGGACAAPATFAPAGSATPSSLQAGASTNLTLEFTRADGEQILSGITTKLPEGMLASLGGVTPCGEPAASQGTCGAASRIGTTTITAGAGPSPLSLEGIVYLTGPYGGQSFGLSIVVPARAGPYNLGTVVVRAALALDTVKGQVTVTTDPLPTILSGIPLRLRHIVVDINRPGFLLEPTDCSASAVTGTLSSTTAQLQPFSTPVQMTGCESLSFSPTLTVTPTSTQRDAPAGLTVAVHLAPGSSDLRSALAELPPGLTLNPAVASGLQACTDEQLGAGTNNPVGCPAASSVGTVEILTPLLPSPLTGTLYVGKPLSDEPGSGQEYRIFLDAENATYDVSVRLVGLLSADPSSGRLTASFARTPAIPFSELVLELNGGPRAPLANPPGCGPAKFTAALTPTSGSTASPGAEYAVDNDGGGGACASSAPFAPTQSAATEPSTAGADSSFTLHLARPDGEQYLARIRTALPAGLLGRIGSFSQCPQAEAAGGSCPASSEIGAVLADVGAGPSPLELPGKVFLTTAYGGSPYGLAITVPAEAVGPFDFGTIVLRARIDIDEHTARATVTSDPLPTIVGGVPLRLQALTVTTGAAFTVNPTSCGAQATESLLSSTAAASRGVSSPFQATGCAAVPFAPSFSAATSAKASRADGASLDVVIAYPAEHEANLASVTTTLPRQLPVRLTTLHDACPEASFAAGPALCPPASRVGEASVLTPLLGSPLSGPAYLVSTGGGEFPDMVIPLAGDGLRLVLRGHTDISSGVITTSFPALPDVPFSRFTLSLPMGPTSILGAGGALCGETLEMPTTLTGQNGSRLTRQVLVTVAGCPPGTSPSAGTGGLSGLRLRPPRFKAAAKGASIARVRVLRGKGRHRGRRPGTIVTYSDRAAAITRFTVLRGAQGERQGHRCVARSTHRRHRGRRCTRQISLGTFTHADRVGTNSFYFTGRVHRHKLAAGSYRLQAIATYPGGAHSRAVQIAFKIARG